MTRPAEPKLRLLSLALLAAILVVFVPKGVSAAGKASAAMLLLLAAAIDWAWQDVQTAADSAQRRFWRLVGTALAAWLLFDLSLALPGSDSDAATALRVACLPASFVSFLLALDERPHLPGQRDERPSKALERIGAVVFTFGLLLYGAGLGRSAENHFFELGQGSLALGFALYLFARLVLLARASGSARWRSAYSALAAGAGALALSEGARLTWGPRSGGAWPVLRLCGPLACAVAAFWGARGRTAFEGVDVDGTETVAWAGREPLGRFWSGSLTLYAMSFPVIHLGGYSLGLLDPELQTVRDGWGLIFLVVLGGLAALHERGIEREVEDVTERFLRHSNYDLLTGLPNRVWFLERVGRSLDRVGRAPDYQFAVLILNLDRYKLIEHGLGPRFGERMLVELVARLKACLRPGDMVARLGEGQFGILADNFRRNRAARDADGVASRIQEHALGQPFHLDSGKEGLGITAREVADRILREAIDPPIELDANEVFLRASIGITLGGTGYTRGEDMLNDAQAAARRAKQRGGATPEIFDPAMQAETSARLALEAELHHAVARSELLLHYQPIVRLDDDGIAGLEALLRWRHPSRGLLAPRDFLAVAEDTGLIVRISQQLIGEACVRTRAWQEAFGRPLFVSYNFAGPQFTAGGLVEGVLEALDRSGLSGRDLRVEITEGVAISNFDAVCETLDRLRQAGVALLIDDFGTGYSSLSYLHRLPATAIKIDRSFVERLPEDRSAETLVRSIVELAHGLGCEVIAEGVETPEQFERVRHLGSDYGQGYYFARPQEADGIEALFKAASRS